MPPIKVSVPILLSGGKDVKGIVIFKTALERMKTRNMPGKAKAEDNMDFRKPPSPSWDEGRATDQENKWGKNSLN